ncbi:MAG: alpha/beta hydrolase [Chitinophagaceae bacterium]|nr:MAG: alpha/beta hydrolase [Chitinophagaceae bacterium]
MNTRFPVILLLSVLFSITGRTQPAFEVVVKGKGDPVFLFPGFGCTSAVFDNVTEELSKTHELHLFTFAGFGNVPPVALPWLATVKDQVIQYIKEKKLIKPTLAGHSLGGTLALWLAASDTGKFKQIIVIDGLPATAALMIPGYRGEPLPFDNPQSRSMLAMDATAFEGMIAQQVKFMCKNPDGQKIIASMMKESDRKTYVYGYIEMLNLDLRKEISKIKAPVVILAATMPDQQTAEKTYKSQFENLKGIKIRFAPQSAHFIMYDQPEWFLKNLSESIK